MQLSISNIAWAPAERLNAYQMMAEFGVGGLEVAPGLLFHAAEDAFAPSQYVARDAISELEDHGLRLVSMQSLLFGVSGAALFDSEASRARLRSAMVRAIDLANRFAIPNLVFGSPKQRCVPSDMSLAQAYDIATSFFKDLGDLAKAAGTQIAIEANPAAYGTNFLTTMEEAADFVAQCQHPSIVPILDLGAMLMNGAYDTSLDWITRLAANLGHVHISEPDLALAPASAATLEPILTRLQATGYGGAVSIEMKRAPEGLDAVKTALTRLCAAKKQEDKQ